MKGNGILETPSKLSVSWTGPDLSKGSLPAFFYFALSAEDSLHLDPYNQPVKFLEGSPIRCFSFTIPFHGPGYENNKSMECWKKEFETNPSFLETFFEQCVAAVDYLINQNLINSQKIAVGGLSRGGFIATHLAARDQRIKYVLGYAPMTRLRVLEELQGVGHGWDLTDLVEKLTHVNLRYYIGNRDLRVGTDACFHFIQALTESMFLQGQRSPPVEMIIAPSVGFKGHGTLPPTFRSGVDWLKQQLI